mmetsp:Transcript_2926/g.7005  ORF Transcript_2926/g.7005 Transcript_2926/m.7005 type:complete len:286 (+) Transcript_2926:2867-3724(+)
MLSSWSFCGRPWHERGGYERKGCRKRETDEEEASSRTPAETLGSATHRPCHESSRVGLRKMSSWRRRNELLCPCKKLFTAPSASEGMGLLVEISNLISTEGTSNLLLLSCRSTTSSTAMLAGSTCPTELSACSSSQMLELPNVSVVLPLTRALPLSTSKSAAALTLNSLLSTLASPSARKRKRKPAPATLTVRLKKWTTPSSSCTKLLPSNLPSPSGLVKIPETGSSCTSTLSTLSLTAFPLASVTSKLGWGSSSAPCSPPAGWILILSFSALPAETLKKAEVSA